MAGRRRVLIALAACALGPWAGRVAAQNGKTSDEARLALHTLLAGRVPQRGRVHLELPPLADNGNGVPLRVRVDSPMRAGERVLRLTLISEVNPWPEILSVEFGPAAARAELATRIRLAGTQTLHALAEMADGQLWGESARIEVLSPACHDGAADASR